MVLHGAPDTEAGKLRPLRLLGWAAPALTTLPYTLHRFHGSRSHCWMDLDLTSSLYLGLPVLAILLANLLSLLAVILVLRSKLVGDQRTAGPAYSLKKQMQVPDLVVLQSEPDALQAAALLVPVLSLHFLLLPVSDYAHSGYAMCCPGEARGRVQAGARL